MNYTSINEAYQVEHIKPTIYSGTLVYSKQCIYCSSPLSIPLLSDGSFRKCNNCKKNFKATNLTTPVSNYNYSTNNEALFAHFLSCNLLHPK